MHGGKCKGAGMSVWGGEFSDIFTSPLGGKAPPPVKKRHPPPRQGVFFVRFLNVNLGFAHVYTPQTFVYTPPAQFQISKNNTGGDA